jgi:hypothetical protein
LQGRFIKMMTCDCGHWRCAQLVSRRSWFRHKVARIVQDQLEDDGYALDDPLPVEEAPEAEENVAPMDVLEEPEVKIP